MRTGRSRPAVALACSPENGLHFAPNSPLTRPADGLGCPVCAAPTALRVPRGNSAPAGDPGREDTIPSLEERDPRRALCRDRISSTNVYPSCARGVALRLGLSAARTPDKRLFVRFRHHNVRFCKMKEKFARNCPLCGSEAEFIYVDYENRRYYNCKSCTLFQISIDAEKKLESIHKEMKDRFSVSAKQCGKDNALVILCDFNDESIKAECLPCHTLPQG